MKHLRVSTIVIVTAAVVIAGASMLRAQADAPGTEPPRPAPAAPARQAPDDGSGRAASSVDDLRGTAIMKASLRYSVLFAVPVNFWIASIFMWDWNESRSFRFANEGWFGQHTYAGGADKAAHLFAHYMVMRALYNFYDYTEDGRPVKWAYSVGMISFLSLSIEIGDAFSRKQNGFSYEDLLCGFAGIGIGIVLERFPAVDRFVSLSASYLPTSYMRRHPGLGPKLFLEDYSGWRFMVNLKLAGFLDSGVPLPEILRFVMIDFGYGSRGFMFTDHIEYHRLHLDRYAPRRRDLYIGVSLNMMEMVKAFFTDRESLACRALQQPFKYYHVPIGYRWPVPIGTR